MARIFTHPPSKEYDEGWDAIFGKQREETKLSEPVVLDPGSDLNLTEEERRLHEQGKWLPGGGVRMPRRKPA